MLHFLRLNPGKAIFAASILLGIAASFAHDAPTHAPPPVVPDEAAFLTENDAAMNRMMSGMAAKPTGDIDRDFVAMMAPHHQGAIDMAVIELRYGKNETLRRIAQEIIVDQMQEIDAMKLAVGGKPTSPAPAPTQPASTPAADHHHMGMDPSAGMKNQGTTQ
jgi:hypothetical protein